MPAGLIGKIEAGILRYEEIVLSLYCAQLSVGKRRRDEKVTCNTKFFLECDISRYSTRLYLLVTL